MSRDDSIEALAIAAGVLQPPPTSPGRRPGCWPRAASAAALLLVMAAVPIVSLISTAATGIVLAAAAVLAAARGAVRLAGRSRR